MSRVAARALLAAGLLVLPIGHLVESSLSGQEPAAAAPAPGAGNALDAESTPESLALFSRAAEAQNGGAFDLATDDWRKFLKDFPKDPLVPKATYYLAVSQISLGKLEEARANLQALTTQYPKADLREDSLLNLGWTSFSIARTTQAADAQAKLYDDAVAALRKQLAEFPADKASKRDQALYFLAESEYLSGKKPESIPHYRELVDKYPESSLAADGAYALGVALEETKAYADAEKVYAAFVAKRPEHELVAEVTMRLGECALQQGLAIKDKDAKTAADLFVRADGYFAKSAAAKDFAAADFAQFRRALAQASRDEFAEAGALYAGVAEKYPNSAYAAEARLLAGQCFYRGEDWDAATKGFDAVIAAGGAPAVEASHWNARILIRQKKFAEAVALADKTLAVEGAAAAPFGASLALDRADALYEIPDRRAAAHDAYLAFVDQHPDSEDAAQALYNAEFASFELKEYARAEAEAKKFLETFAGHRLVPDVRNVAAESQLLRGDHAAAEASFAALAKDFADRPESLDWKLRRAATLYYAKKYDETQAAVAELDETLPKPAQQAEAKFLAGASHYYEKNYDAAIADLGASLTADAARTGADEARLLLARAHFAKGDFAETLKQLDQFLAAYPNSPLLDQALYRQGEAQTAAKAWDAARAAYAKVLEAHGDSPFVPFALYGAGWADLQAGRFDAAVPSFATLLEKHPDTTLKIDALLAKASALRQAGKPDAALVDLDAALKEELPAERQAQALHEKGLALQAQKKPVEAAAAFAAALAAQPDYAAADAVLYERAWALKETPEKGAEAVTSFAELAEKFPNSPLAPEARFHVAESKYAAKDFPAAADLYAAALAGAKADELIEKATYKLAWSKYQAGDYAAAADAFAKLAEKFPGGSLALDGWFMLGESRLKLKEYEPALAAYRQAQSKLGENAAAEMTALLHVHAGQAANQLKRYKEALELLAPITEKRANDPLAPQAFFETGRAHQGLNAFDPAIVAYRAAADKSRDVVGAEARFLLGEVLFAQKKHEEAFDEFRRCLFGYGGDAAPPEVKVWQAKSAYEAARCRDVQAGAATGEAKQPLFAEALKYYRTVAEKFPQDDLAAVATKRANEIAGSVGS